MLNGDKILSPSRRFRRTSQCAVLTACLIVCVRPIGPAIAYLINHDYIATVLCVNADRPEKKCHGKCFLKLTMEKSMDLGSSSAGITEGKIAMHWDQVIGPGDDIMNTTGTFDFARISRVQVHSCISNLPFIPPEHRRTLQLT